MDFETQPIASPMTSLPTAPKTVKGMSDAQIDKAAKDFESVLIQKLMEEMRSTVDESGLLEGDAGGQQVQGIFWSHLAKDVSEKGGMGLWKEISRQMKIQTAAERAAHLPEAKP